MHVEPGTWHPIPSQCQTRAIPNNIYNILDDNDLAPVSPGQQQIQYRLRKMSMLRSLFLNE